MKSASKSELLRGFCGAGGLGESEDDASEVVWRGVMLETPPFRARTAQKIASDQLHMQLLNRRDVLFSCSTISELFPHYEFQHRSAICIPPLHKSPAAGSPSHPSPPFSHKNTLGCVDAAVFVYVSRHLTHHLARMAHLVRITCRINQSALCVCVHARLFSRDGLLLGELGSKRDV